MERNGTKLRELAPGDRRRMADGKNAWRKMSPDQRGDFLRWAAIERAPVYLDDGEEFTDFALASTRASQLGD